MPPRVRNRIIILLTAICLVSLSCDLAESLAKKADLEASETAQIQQKLATQGAQTVAAANERGESPVPSITPAPPTEVPTLDISCRWVQTSITDALATGGGTPGMTAEWKDNWIGTRYLHAGNMGCSDQEFVTAHEWLGLEDELIAGKPYTFTVTLTWRLEGTPECSSLTAGAKTSLTAGTTVVEISQSKIVLAKEPNGDLENTGRWTAPAGKEGDTLTIKAHGSSGSLGGTVSFNYEYTCSNP